ncbi:hypothetical protein B0A65_03660 [Flavobacterium frigidimaris]|uniref:Secreted protein n=1 Tax=Flavobacterium frigidimaris TaxID=262320 RepID=A0ABX4BVG0_FLAFR|nr:hypothetical protein B0A65_03660 [Flavobacterium frigidimaris]
MVKNKIIFFMLFYLSDANIAHFRNYFILSIPKIKYTCPFLSFFYEFNIIRNKKGALKTERLLKIFLNFLLVKHFPKLVF